MASAPRHALPAHIATLDLLRFAAALAVVAYHYLHRGALDGAFMDVRFETGRLLGLGVEQLYLGVHLFFVISGFVIMASVRDRGALSFTVARFVRLWPTFVACMSITAALLWVASDARFPVSFDQWVANLVIASPLLGHDFVDGVYWSIVLEIVFYAWVALLIAVGVLPRHVLAFATVWLALAAGNELILGSDVARLVLVTRFAPWFLFGVLMHHLLVRGGGPWSAALVAGTLALAMHNVAVEQIAVTARYGTATDVPAVLIANAVLLLAFLAALQWRLALPPAGWLTALGALTYPLYLLHQNIGYLALERLTPVVGKHAALAVTVAAVLALAWLVSEAFDRPVRRLLNAVIARLRNAAPLSPRRASA